MKLKLFITLLFTTHIINSQSIDSIKFNSPFEKKLITKSQKDSSNTKYLQSLLAIDSIVNEQQAIEKIKIIDDFLTKINTKKFKRQKERKKVKILFNKIHDNFFEKYEAIVNFNKIFSHKVYNCVTASALYSYAFDKFNIPYHIKETPTHVYLIAYPNKHNIYVETTIPGNEGFYSPSEKDIQKAVDELIKSKLLTQKNVNKIGYKKAYNDFFYQKEFIGKNELIGIQYYNKAITFLNNEKFNDAYNSLLKSEIFYKNKKIRFLKISILSLITIESEYKKLEDIKNLVSLLNILELNKDYKEKDLKYYIATIINANENNDDFLLKSLTEFNNCSNKTVANIFKKNIYKYIAEKNARLNKNIKKTLSYAEKSYAIDPNDEGLKNIISYSITRSFTFSTPNKGTLKKLNVYAKKYPFIKDSFYYKSYIIIIYSYLTERSFFNKKLKDGKLYFEKLKNIINKTKEDININEQAVGTAYWSVGAYYYSINQLKKAKKILEEGKKLAPEHEKLNKILGYINEDLK